VIFDHPYNDYAHLGNSVKIPRLNADRPIARGLRPAGAFLSWYWTTGFSSYAALGADMPIRSGGASSTPAPCTSTPGNIHLCAEPAQPPLVLIDAGLVGHRIPIPWDGRSGLVGRGGGRAAGGLA
jgi:hypothetical protein